MSINEQKQNEIEMAWQQREQERSLEEARLRGVMHTLEKVDAREVMEEPKQTPEEYRQHLKAMYTFYYGDNQ